MDVDPSLLQALTQMTVVLISGIFGFVVARWDHTKTRSDSVIDRKLGVYADFLSAVYDGALADDRYRSVAGRTNAFNGPARWRLLRQAGFHDDVKTAAQRVLSTHTLLLLLAGEPLQAAAMRLLEAADPDASGETGERLGQLASARDEYLAAVKEELGRAAA